MLPEGNQESYIASLVSFSTRSEIFTYNENPKIIISKQTKENTNRQSQREISKKKKIIIIIIMKKKKRKKEKNAYELTKWNQLLLTEKIVSSSEYG